MTSLVSEYTRWPSSFDLNASCTEWAEISRNPHVGLHTHNLHELLMHRMHWSVTPRESWESGYRLRFHASLYYSFDFDFLDRYTLVKDIVLSFKIWKAWFTIMTGFDFYFEFDMILNKYWINIVDNNYDLLISLFKICVYVYYIWIFIPEYVKNLLNHLQPNIFTSHCKLIRCINYAFINTFVEIEKYWLFFLWSCIF